MNIYHKIYSILRIEWHICLICIRYHNEIPIRLEEILSQFRTEIGVQVGGVLGIGATNNRHTYQSSSSSVTFTWNRNR